MPHAAYIRYRLRAVSLSDKPVLAQVTLSRPNSQQRTQSHKRFHDRVFVAGRADALGLQLLALKQASHCSTKTGSWHMIKHSSTLCSSPLRCNATNFQHENGSSLLFMIFFFIFFSDRRLTIMSFSPSPKIITKDKRPDVGTNRSMCRLVQAMNKIKLL